MFEISKLYSLCSKKVITGYKLENTGFESIIYLWIKALPIIVDTSASAKRTNDIIKIPPIEERGNDKENVECNVQCGVDADRVHYAAYHG